MSTQALPINIPIESDAPAGVEIAPPEILAIPGRRSASDASHKSFVRHAKVIGILTLLSRVLGLARESVSARWFGAGAVSSAFTVAFKVPNLFRKLLGEGALSVAFIPLYAQSLKNDGAKAANEFAAASVTLLCAILLGLTFVGEAALWATGHFGNLESDNLLMVRFAAIMLPYVLMICGAAFLSGILQVHRRFALPAVTPIVLNAVHVVVIVLGARLLGLRGASGAEKFALQTKLAYWLAFFVLVAGVLQIAILIPSLRAVGFEFKFVRRWRTPLVKKMLKLSIPVALSAGVLQASVVIDTAITVYLTRRDNPAATMHWFGHSIAYPLAVGAVARLNWAQFLYQFPLGVFAIAIATAIFPALSVDAMEKDRTKFKAVLRHGIEATLFEGFAASLGLILVRYPAIRLLFQHGNFTSDDTRWVALSTIFFGAAIWAFSLQQILNRAFFSMHDTVTPLILSIVTIIINTVVEVPLAFSKLGEAGLAAGTFASFSVQAIVMLILLDRRVGGLGLPAIALQAGKFLAACGVMAAACIAMEHMPIFPRGHGTIASLMQLGMLMVVGAGAYVGACAGMGVRVREILAPGHAG